MIRLNALLLTLASTVLVGNICLAQVPPVKVTAPSDEPELPPPPRFPELKPSGGLPEGYTWVFTNGPDFYVYSGISKANPAIRVGIYFGHHPSFKTNPSYASNAGAIASLPVTWFRTSKGKAKVRLETVLPYTHPGGYDSITLHIWVQAPTQKMAEDLCSNLSSIAFEQRGSISHAP